MSEWFAELGKLSWVTIAMLAIALVGGIAAVVKREHAKKIILASGVLEALVLAAALICFIAGSDAAKTFEDVYMSSWLYTLIVALVAAAMLAVMALSGRREKWTARDISTAAICVAMSFVLSCIKLYRMPQGGTVTPASILPMVLYIAAFGPARGLAVGFAYGLLQLVQDPYIIHPAQMLIDYPMAFGAMALAGFAKYLPIPKIAKLPTAVVLAYIGRYVMAVLSGAIFFAEYAGEQNAWIYSMTYNISYIGPDCIVAAIVALIPGMSRISDLLSKRAAE